LLLRRPEQTPANDADLFHRRIGLRSVRHDLTRAPAPLQLPLQDRQSRAFVARGRGDGVENLAFVIEPRHKYQSLPLILTKTGANPVG
jgi:hypothetical protein